MRISDWSSDVCSSDLSRSTRDRPRGSRLGDDFLKGITDQASDSKSQTPRASSVSPQVLAGLEAAIRRQIPPCADRQVNPGPGANENVTVLNLRLNRNGRSEENTAELQSLMRISYAVF